MSSFRVRYQTIEFGDIDIHLRTLRDNQQFSDPEGIAERLGISSATWPLFGVVWPSGLVMAHFLLEQEWQHKRILEIGCGIGLSSLLLNRMQADITATDYHPEVNDFLQQNAALNNDRCIPFAQADWSAAETALETTLGLFDLVVGSDVLYEDEHALVLAAFIDAHANRACKVVVVDPGRGYHGRFSRQMVEAGFSYTKTKPGNTCFLADPFPGHILEYERSVLEV